MYTYTTPTITCTLAGIELSQIDYVRIAISGSKGKLVRIVSASEIDEAGKTMIQLTQEETAALGKGDICIQGRIRYNDGTVQPTNKIHKNMDEVLDRVVI